MELSVIVVHFNTFGLTCRCLESIRKHTTGIDYEVIVVDNSSSDNPAGLSVRFPEIKLIYSETNLGFAGGNNLGIDHSNGKYILLLNSDTELTENSFISALNRFKDIGECGALGVRLQYPDGRLQHSAQRFPSLKIELAELFRLQKVFGNHWAASHLLGSYFDHQSEIQSDWVWGTFFLFERSSLSKLPGGKLSDRFFMYGEDIDWGMQFRKAGLNIWYSPITTIIHHQAASARDNQRFDQMSIHEKELLIQWNGRPITILIYLIRITKHLSRFKAGSFALAKKNWQILWQ